MPFYEVVEYVCSLEDKLTGTEITHASIPVSVTRTYYITNLSIYQTNRSLLFHTYYSTVLSSDMH